MKEPMHALPRLRELRKAKDKSIRQLAREAHVSTESIHRLERGGKARTGTRDALAEALDVHPWKLVFDGDTVDKAFEEDEAENAILKQKMLDMSVKEWDEFLNSSNPRIRETRRRIGVAIEHHDELRRRFEGEAVQDAG